MPIRAAVVAAAAATSGARGQDEPAAPGGQAPPVEAPPAGAAVASRPDEVSLPEAAAADRFTFSGIIAGAYQLQLIDGANEDGGALTVRSSFDFAATDTDHLHLTLALAGGNGINDVTVFQVPPWGADLEDDVQDINGSSRSYILTAWYRHTFDSAEDHTLALSGGLIDATEYLDANVFANDEYTQFMNAGLVNASNGFFPSYDVGIAAEWSYGPWSINGVGMWFGANVDGDPYAFGGLQLAYRLDTSIGEGNYRLILTGTSEDLFDPTGRTKERLLSAFFSVDQRFGEVLGAWGRFGTENADAANLHRGVLSGGIDITGGAWGRPQDTVGLGYAYLGEGNIGVDSSQVLESYVRFGVTESLDLTLDAQYMRDVYDAGGAVSGWILGLRCVFAF